MADNGGPAFPYDQDRDYKGMWLREYFAAHAPAVPDWFEHVPLTREGLPKKPGMEQFSTEKNPYPSNWSDRDAAAAWLNDPCFDLDIPGSEEWQKQAKVYWAANKQWKFGDKMQRLTQWAFAWADAMIAQSQSE